MEFYEWASVRERELKAKADALEVDEDGELEPGGVQVHIEHARYRMAMEAYQEYTLSVTLADRPGGRGQGVQPLGHLSELRDLLRRV